MSGEADSADIRVCKKWECSKPCVLCYGLSTEGGLSCKSRPSCGEDFVCFISGGRGGTCQISMRIASKLKWLGFFLCATIQFALFKNYYRLVTQSALNVFVMNAHYRNCVPNDSLYTMYSTL